jgi:hypothetical protein
MRTNWNPLTSLIAIKKNNVKLSMFDGLGFSVRKVGMVVLAVVIVISTMTFAHSQLDRPQQQLIPTALKIDLGPLA